MEKKCGIAQDKDFGKLVESVPKLILFCFCTFIITHNQDLFIECCVPSTILCFPPFYIEDTKMMLEKIVFGWGAVGGAAGKFLYVYTSSIK